MSTHQFPIRVYYEDTDHGGVVYYANYLKFMERGRTEFLRSHGINLDRVHQEQGVMFAVTHVDIHYHTPAIFNDALHVESALTQCKGARLQFTQRILRTEASQTTLLTQAVVDLACIDDAGKPSRIPSNLLSVLKQYTHKEL